MWPRASDICFLIEKHPRALGDRVVLRRGVQLLQDLPRGPGFGALLRPPRRHGPRRVVQAHFAAFGMTRTLEMLGGKGFPLS